MEQVADIPDLGSLDIRDLDLRLLVRMGRSYSGVGVSSGSGGPVNLGAYQLLRAYMRARHELCASAIIRGWNSAAISAKRFLMAAGLSSRVSPPT